VSEPREGKNVVKHEVITFLPPIQVGYEIYYENLEIEEIQDRQDSVWQFIQGSSQLLEWEQEPSNPKDPFAIKIFGISEQVFSTRHEMLGYVPGNIAKEVVNGGLWPFLQLRLDSIYVANHGHIAIRFQILGPIRKKPGGESTTERLIIERGITNSEVRLPTIQSDKAVGNPKNIQNNFKQVFFFILRMFVITLGIGLAFVGGKIGTAAWQIHENPFSMVMIFPVILIISGGVLIWTGIKPSKAQEIP
jgi:hypothetical protein